MSGQKINSSWQMFSRCWITSWKGLLLMLLMLLVVPSSPLNASDLSVSELLDSMPISKDVECPGNQPLQNPLISKCLGISERDLTRLISDLQKKEGRLRTRKAQDGGVVMSWQWLRTPLLQSSWEIHPPALSLGELTPTVKILFRVPF